MNFDVLRREMVHGQLIARGDITDQRVLAAFLKVPRHKFIPSGEQKSAYGDFPLPISCGQTISQPYIVALMTQCLKLKAGARVLEVGTGSGYQAAILAELAGEVYTVERFAQLSESAKEALSDLGYSNIRFKAGDGTLGWQEYAPFNGIIVTAGAPKAPQPLLEQLADGGRLVIPIGEQTAQILTIFEKKADKIKSIEACGCVFVPLIGKEGWLSGK